MNSYAEKILKDWIDSFPTISIEDEELFILNIKSAMIHYQSIKVTRDKTKECRSGNGFDMLAKDLKKIDEVIKNVKKNPLLNEHLSPYRMVITNLENAKSLLNKKLEKSKYVKDMLLDSHFSSSSFFELQGSGRINNDKQIRGDFIREIAIIFKDSTGRKDLTRTKEDYSKHSKSPFFTLIKVIYKLLNMEKEKSLIEREIKEATINL